MNPSTKLNLVIIGAIATMTACSHNSTTHQSVTSTLHSTASPSPTQLVDSLNQVFGDHHKRASHAKGFCATGSFTPNADATHLSNAGVFSTPSEATLRFSIGGGNPKASDKSRSVRGLAVRLNQADEQYDLLMISEPVFFASTPESFVSFLQARVADPATKKPDPEKVKAHNEKYPEAKLQPAMVAAHTAPASYVTTPYFTTNAFGLVNATNETKWARLTLEPKAGRLFISEDEEKSLADDFLEGELNARLAHGAAEFTLYAQLANHGDSLINPAVEWPADRKRVALGVLSIKATRGQRCDSDVFIPTNLPHGIIASDDPILKARAAAYAVSKSRR